VKVPLHLFPFSVFIHPDLDQVSLLDSLFKFIILPGYFLLNITCFNRFNHSTHLINYFHLLNNLLLHLLCQGFDEIGTCQGIYSISQSDLLHEDLEGSEREEGGSRCGDGIRFIKGTERSCLSPTQCSGEGIIGTADDIIFRLGFGHPISTPTENSTEEKGSTVLGAITFLQIDCPEFSGCTEFGHLLPEVSKDIEIEGEASNKIINFVTSFENLFDIGIGNLKGVSDFLDGRTS